MAMTSLAISTAAIASLLAEPQVRKKPHDAHSVDPETKNGKREREKLYYHHYLRLFLTQLLLFLILTACCYYRHHHHCYYYYNYYYIGVQCECSPPVHRVITSLCLLATTKNSSSSCVESEGGR